MKKRIVVLLTVLAVASLACALAGCAGPSGSSSASSSGQKTVAIELPANATTGYEWAYSMEPEGVLAEKSNEYVAPDTDRVGAPGVQKYAFEATADGEVTLSFEYARSWENEKPDSTATYEIVVKDGLIESVESAQNFSEGLKQQA